MVAPVDGRRRMLGPLGGEPLQGHVVCFPHAGGTASGYHWWVDQSPERQVWGVTLPGRGRLSAEPVARDWPSLVARLVSEVARLRGPVVLLGYSLGALLAYEVARDLTARGAPPAHLVVVARGAPETGPVVSWPDDDGRLLELVAERYGGVPDAVRDDHELLRATVPILRADLELVRTYAWLTGPPLTCPVTAVRGERDETTPPGALAAWAWHTRGDFHAATVPGGHFISGQGRAELAAIVRERAFT